MEKAISGQQTLSWLLGSRPAGTTLGRGRRCSFLESQGQALLESGLTRVGAAAMAEFSSWEETCLRWGPDSQPSLRGDQEPEETCPTNWTSHWTFLGRKGSLFLVRNQVLFSVLTWFQGAALSNPSAFLCSKKENDAALPMNSWGPSLLCDTLHMNLRATLAASHMWLQLLL